MTISVYTKEKNVRVTVEFRVPKRYSLRPTLFMDMVQHVLRWGRQKRCSSRRRKKSKGQWQKNIIVINFDGIFVGEEKMKSKEDKRMTKLDFLFRTAFLNIIKQNSTHSLLVHDHSSSSTFGLHLVRGPKAL
jgi:hypothetical protein